MTHELSHDWYLDRRRLIEEEAHQIFQEQVDEGLISQQEAEDREHEWLARYHTE